LNDRARARAPAPTVFERAMAAASDAVGFARSTVLTRIAAQLEGSHSRRLKDRVKSLNWELFDRAVGAADWAALQSLLKIGGQRRRTARAAAPCDLADLRSALDKPFSVGLLLWKKTKSDLRDEMDTALQMPGWGNSFTQPIANRIEMLSTGVRQPVA